MAIMARIASSTAISNQPRRSRSRSHHGIGLRRLRATEDIMLKQIGFALAIGILIDAFIIRMALVPAVMAAFGDHAWRIPRWLDRLLPNLDVEGDKLIAELNAQEQNKAKSNSRK